MDYGACPNEIAIDTITIRIIDIALFMIGWG
jgi:hypothetical protein